MIQIKLGRSRAMCLQGRVKSDISAPGLGWTQFASGIIAEAEIARGTDIIAKIDTALALPDIFTRDPKQGAQLSKARANAADALARAE
ncbi:hypothetical protein [Bradyrhizobium sp. CCBAU 51745]|uniref:hypothetical protein n=1 Tax=Bradyrhizobium sp. CCBAU 51745 TaxID=1325099 RepID=UPI0023069452|nr:hypothetical protein [Bradyrhizobium sp. CCBAU 51745]